MFVFFFQKEKPKHNVFVNVFFFVYCKYNRGFFVFRQGRVLVV